MNSSHTSVSLAVLAGEFAVCRLADPPELPGPQAAETLFCATLTDDGWTVVCGSERVPAGGRVEPGWRCLQVRGPLAFSEAGILAALTAPLAEARIPVFALSTYDTDYLLVKGTELAGTVKALRSGGHRVDDPPSARTSGRGNP